MPIYEYECKACGDVQEVMQKLSDPPPAECVACHQGPLVKLMSRTGFILKGEGWYVTDFRDKGKKPPAKAKEAEGGSAPAAASSSEGTASSSSSSPGESSAASSTPATKPPAVS